MSSEIINIQPEVYKRGGVYNQKTILKTHTEKIYACNKTDLTDSNGAGFQYRFDFPKNCIPSTARLYAKVRAAIASSDDNLGVTETYVSGTNTTYCAFKNGVLNNLFENETVRDAASQEISKLNDRYYTKSLAHLRYLKMSDKEANMFGALSGFYTEANTAVNTTLNEQLPTLNALAVAATAAAPATFKGKPLSPFFENSDVLWFQFQLEMTRAENNYIVYNAATVANPIKPIITQLYFLVDVVDQSSVKDPVKAVWYPIKNYFVDHQSVDAGAKTLNYQLTTTQQRPHKLYMLFWRDAKHAIMNHDSHPNGLTNIKVIYTSKTNGTDTYSPSSEGYTVTTTSGAWVRNQDNVVRAFDDTMEVDGLVEKNKMTFDRWIATFRGDWYLCFDLSPDRLGYPIIVKEEGTIRIEGAVDVNCVASHAVFVIEYDSFYQVDGAGKVKKLM